MDLVNGLKRRHSRARGMLFYRLREQIVQVGPRTYHSLIVARGFGDTGCRVPAWRESCSTTLGAGRRCRPKP